MVYYTKKVPGGHISLIWGDLPRYVMSQPDSYYFSSKIKLLLSPDGVTYIIGEPEGIFYAILSF